MIHRNVDESKNAGPVSRKLFEIAQLLSEEAGAKGENFAFMLVAVPRDEATTVFAITGKVGELAAAATIGLNKQGPHAAMQFSIEIAKNALLPRT